MPPSLKAFLDQKVSEYNQPLFLANDPILVPHRFSRKQDIEIAGFFAAIFAWGNRTTIINKSLELMDRMNGDPYRFCLEYSSRLSRRLEGFRHRTFCTDDLLYFVEFFNRHYQQYESLEPAFARYIEPGDASIENGLIGFRRYFFEDEHLKRTEKHIASPEQKSTCKRLNMFLRWMVRRDEAGVDFGLWHSIDPRQLVCPIDVHVARVAQRFGLLKRKQVDWLAALELTQYLRTLDPNDPVRYDFALFGLGAIEKF